MNPPSPSLAPCGGQDSGDGEEDRPLALSAPTASSSSSYTLDESPDGPVEAFSEPLVEVEVVDEDEGSRAREGSWSAPPPRTG